MEKIKYILLTSFEVDDESPPRPEFFSTHAEAHKAMTEGINKALKELEELDPESRLSVSKGINYDIGVESAWAVYPICENMAYKIFRLGVAENGNIRVLD